MLIDFVLFLRAEIMAKDFDYKKLCSMFGTPSLAGQKSMKAPQSQHRKDAETGASTSIPRKDQVLVSRSTSITATPKIISVAQPIQQVHPPRASFQAPNPNNSLTY